MVVFVCIVRVSANADPTRKNCASEIPTRKIRNGQPQLSAMLGPHIGQTTYMIIVKPTPGKYAYNQQCSTPNSLSVFEMHGDTCVQCCLFLKTCYLGTVEV